MARAAEKQPSNRTRRGWVVHQLLRSIFTGEFQGGDRLVEQELAASVGVSRTPIREALGELAVIGLVQLKPNHGAIVRPFGPTQIREIYHLRWLLEAEATRLATSRIELASLLHIREQCQRLLAEPQTPAWIADTLALDQAFHELISGNCGNARLAEEIGRYRALIQSIRLAVGNSAHAQETALVEHGQIIDQMLARNATAAASAMVDHIRRGTESAVSALFSSSRQNSAREVEKAQARVDENG